MQTFFFEIKTDCNNCRNPLIINALVQQISCEHCNQKNEIPFKLWKSLVADNINEASNYLDGQKRSMKIKTGSYEFSLNFGKRKAHCQKCQLMIPENVFDSFESGEYKCTDCGNQIHIRKTDGIAKEIIPSSKYIVGEDKNQLNTCITGIKKPEAAKPIIFSCPACAANLEVDGIKRIITCKFCDARVYLPDDLWYELHPAKIVERWYIICE